MRQRLADLSLVNFDKIPKDRIILGSKVVLLDVDKDEKITYKLVTSEDANVDAGLDLHNVADRPQPTEQKRRRHRRGEDTIGNRTFEILSFTTMHDEQVT